MNRKQRAASGPIAPLMIRASAGSGKTYQLTSRYLLLVARDVPVERIVATTFTRKAAAEILSRVLTRLAGAANNAQDLKELGRALAIQNFARSRCLAVLVHLARHIHRLRIGTLDSLFGQMARAFSLELDLPPGWTIADEAAQAALRADAVARLLADQDADDVSRLVHVLSKGAPRQSVVQLIDDAVCDLYGLFQETHRDAWFRLPRRALVDERTLTSAKSAIQAVTLDDKRFAKARDSDLDLADRLQWDQFLGRGLAPRIAADDLTYYKKPIPDELVAPYRTLIDHAAAIIVNQIATQTEGTYELLQRFDEHYRRLQQSRRLLRFEDITRRLGQWTNRVTADGSEPTRELDLLAYRLDARIDHLLLDEFQDTSLAQWNVLRPIARHTTTSPRSQSRERRESESRSFFCVGDPKQAIYGWRGGLVEIFDALGQQLNGLQSEQLATSRRSAQPIIDVVNHVFRTPNQLLAVERGAQGFTNWLQQFPAHSTAHPELPGYVTLETPADIPDEAAADGDAVTCCAADRIASLVAQAPGYQIGVLMRSNTGIARIIHALRQRGVAASEEGGNFPTDSAAVQLVVSALQLADHPGDTVARFHLVHSPLGAALDLRSTPDDHAAERVSRKLRLRLAEWGYGTVIEGWARHLANHVSTRDRRRLEQIVELAYQRESDMSLRPGDFARLLAVTRMPDARLAPVRVTTIHQSKGLEYDIVVLPELTTYLCGQRGSVATGRSQLAGPIDTVCRDVAGDLQPLLPPSFQRMFARQDDADVVESLCLLYVAMTRAVHALHMIIPASTPSESRISATAAGVLRSALTTGEKLPPGIVAYAHGDPNWAQRGAEPQHAPTAAAVAAPVPVAPSSAPLPITLAPCHGPRRRGLERLAPSLLEGGQTRRLGQLLPSVSPGGRTRGTLVHRWCESLTWLDECPPSIDGWLSLAAAAPDFAWTAAELSEIARDLLAAIQTAEIAQWLRRSTYLRPTAGDWPEPVARQLRAASHLRLELLAEHPFAIRSDDQIISGQIDRLVLIHDGPRLIAADILDYKTDTIDAADPNALGQRVEYYRPQLAAYRWAISKWCDLPLDQITTRLLLLGPRRAVRVDD